MIAFCVCAVFAANTSLLLSPEQLAQDLDAWQIVDTRGAEAYGASHIPGARHLDPDDLSEECGGVAGLLKPVEALTPLLAAAGLDPDQPVLIYSAMEKTSDLKRATRLFWILEYLSYRQVAVLDGGFARWAKAGHPVADQPETIPAMVPGSLKLRPRPELLATHDEVSRMIEKNEGTLVDNRPAAQYAGLEQSGVAAKPGHIAGACSIPVDELLDPETLALKQGAALEEATAELRPEAPVVTYCNTGRDATAGYFGLRLRGIENVSVYDGSMAEWSRLPQLSVQE